MIGAYIELRPPTTNKHGLVGYVIDGQGCWIWTGTKSKSGYGTVYADGRMQVAHRWVYEMSKGPVPRPLVLDHLCRNRACVNPDHLRVTTNRENVLCGKAPTAINAAKTHCIHGHALTPGNFWRRANGGRKCRPCGLATRRRRHAEALAAEERVPSLLARIADLEAALRWTRGYLKPYDSHFADGEGPGYDLYREHMDQADALLASPATTDEQEPRNG